MNRTSGYHARDSEADHQQDDKIRHASNLPFGQYIPLSSISGPTYLSGQTLVQQVVFALSDKIYSYSPESFDLDLSVKQWHQHGECNVHGYAPFLFSMDTRTGAGSVALGYMFCNDFDSNRRHTPQSFLASSASLYHLRPAIEDLVRLYDVANPTVLHTAAVDYEAGTAPGFITDYVGAQLMADELGLGLVASSSTHEMQHMSLFATLMAILLPTIHIYDGVTVARETTRVFDALDQTGLQHNCLAILQQLSNAEKKTDDNETRVSRLIWAFNNELGTEYRLFEYHGHVEPQTVFVVFGTVEASLAGQIVRALADRGARVGLVNVRVYRPFAEDEFLQVLPPSVLRIAVLGQVKDDSDMDDDSSHSPLYADVLAAVAFATHIEGNLIVVELKYSRSHAWDPKTMAALIQHACPDMPDVDWLDATSLCSAEDMQQYTVWDLDTSASLSAPVMLARLLSGNSATNVAVRTGHDNLIQGGAVRTDIRSSKRSIEAAFSIIAANVVYIGDEKLLDTISFLASVQSGCIVIANLPGFKQDELEKRLSPRVRKAFAATEQLQLHVLDPTASAQVARDPRLESYLVQLAFLHLARSDLYTAGLKKLNKKADILDVLAKDLDTTLHTVQIPESWKTIELEADTDMVLPEDLKLNSFRPVDVDEDEPRAGRQDWTAVAKGLAFKEAYGTTSALRPDLGVRTAVIHVKEHRRLTPTTYDRNIFHIDFDLADSGLTYEIGEALGVHPENDHEHVDEFIKWYGLNANELVQVPSREEPSILETRTIYQSLVQNMDIFGRPPKRFYEALAEYAEDDVEKTQLLLLGTGGNQESQVELKRRAEVDTVTFADVLLEFSSAHPSINDIVRIVNPIKRREYSVASSQRVQPDSISLLIVTVNWVDPKGRDRFGQCTRYLNALPVGAPVTVSVKPSVMKLPPKTTQPIIMAGLGTGLAPFRAFVQERAWQKQHGQEIGQVMLFMGSRHQREEYLYGEEWEAYRDAGVITHMGCAFSRDQPQKVYIQDRMRQMLTEIRKSYLQDDGAFYLCGPTWPVPDVTNVLEEAIEVNARIAGKKVDSRREIDRLKDELRYVLEVY